MNLNREKYSIIGALAWNMFERIGVQGIQLSITIILARILLPYDYGIAALITAIIAIASVVVEQGVSSAIIQMKSISEREINSLFTIGLIISIMLYAGLIILAPNIALFYDNYDTSQLKRLIRIYAIVLPIGSFTSIQYSVIYRNMEFKKSFFLNIICIVVSGSAGIILAINGYGVWALAVQQIISRIVSLVTLTIVLGWIPHPVIPDRLIIPALRFSVHVLGNSLISVIYNQFRSFLIAKHYSSIDLAFYNKGELFPAIIATNTDYALQKVMFSVYSKKQEHLAEVKSVMRQTINISTFFLMPIMIGLLAISKDLVILVLTDKWISCVPFMQIFCLIYLLQPIKTTISQALNGIGMSKNSYRLGLYSKIIGIIFILFIFRKGTIYIAIVTLVTEFLTSFFYIFAAQKHFSYSIREQAIDITLNIVTAGLMIIGIALMSFIFCLPLWIDIILKIILGVCIYMVSNLIFRNIALKYLVNLFKRWMIKYSKV